MLPTTTTTEVPVDNTTRLPYDIVNNADGTIVDTPVHRSVPVTRTACGIQIFTGKYYKF